MLWVFTLSGNFLPFFRKWSFAIVITESFSLTLTFTKKWTLSFCKLSGIPKWQKKIKFKKGHSRKIDRFFTKPKWRGLSPISNWCISFDRDWLKLTWKKEKWNKIKPKKVWMSYFVTIFFAPIHLWLGHSLVPIRQVRSPLTKKIIIF